MTSYAFADWQTVESSSEAPPVTVTVRPMLTTVLRLTVEKTADSLPLDVPAPKDEKQPPRSVDELYAEIATRHAIVREVDPGVWLARVIGLDGAWTDGDTPEEALAALPEAILDWVRVKRAIGASDIPPMEGLDLNTA